MQRQLRPVADQRFDLPHYELMSELIAAEFHAINKAFITDKNFIVKNWKIEDAGGLTVRVNFSADSLLINSERVGKEKLNYRQAGFTPLTHVLEDNSVNYVELDISTMTTAEDSVARWDATANSGAGEEYIQNSDLVQAEAATIVSNVIGWSPGTNRIPLAMVTTLGGSVVSVVDMREFLFHLATDWDFGVTRTDKTIGSIKDNDDALKTCIKEMKGTPNWYDSQGITTQNLLERLNYLLVDGGDISWGLPAPAKGSLVAIASDPNNGVKDGDTLEISDGTTAVVFEFDSDSMITPGHSMITIPVNGTATQVKTAIINAINAHIFQMTASSGTGNRIELQNNVNGTAGNVTIVEVLANAGTVGASLSPVGMAGGRSTNALAWTVALKIVAPGRAYSYAIDAQSVANVADGEVVYVTLPAEGTVPGGALTVQKCAAADYQISTTATRNYILAYRSGTKIYFGNGWQNVELEDGETGQLGDGIPNAWLTATGLLSEYDDTPPYESNNWVSPDASFTKAISELDEVAETMWNMLAGKIYDEYVTSDGGVNFQTNAYVTLPPPFGAGANQTYQTGFNQLEVSFNGRKARLGVDWAEDANLGAGVGNRIKLLVDLPNNCDIGFRIQTGGGQEGTVSTAAADVYDEGILVSTSVGRMNFVGAGVFVEESAPNEVTINIRYPRELAKLVKNGTGVSIPAGTSIAWHDDNTVAPSDANVTTLSDWAGITLETILPGAFGLAGKAGNVPGVLVGMGATAGQRIFMGEVPGSLTLTPPPLLTDTILCLGNAEPGDGVATSADDLWLAPQLVTSAL